VAQSLLETLKMIERHIEASERNIIEQRHRVRQMDRGRNAALSRSILNSLEDSLCLHYEHRTTVLRELAARSYS
jgi:hypothetical protein